MNEEMKKDYTVKYFATGRRCNRTLDQVTALIKKDFSYPENVMQDLRAGEMVMNWVYTIYNTATGEPINKKYNS